MATTVRFVSEKGGVGKTTTCYYVAVSLGWHHKKRVLVVDSDYQRGGISCRFVPSLIEKLRIGQVLGINLVEKIQSLHAGRGLIRELISWNLPWGDAPNPQLTKVSGN